MFVVRTTRNRGRGSLRTAIRQANRRRHDVRIEFAVGSGPVTITPTRRLPAIKFSGVVDGWSQPGDADRPLVELSGAAVRSGPGLHVRHDGVTICGLAVTGWPGVGIWVRRASGVELAGLHVGVRPDGRTAAGNGESGILLDEAHGCAIGGPGDAGVVASGNTGHGILVRHSAGLRVAGSRLGTDREGRVAVPNGQSGIKANESPDLVVGGAVEGSGNVVSGNGRYGVEIGGADSRNATVTGNRVGTDVTGSVAIPNVRDGVVVHSSPGVRIGGPTPLEANVISGNNLYGIEIIGPLAERAVVVGNLVGTDAAGAVAIPNGRSGVLVYNAFGARIGGPGPGDGNIISGGARGGVNLDGSVREGHDWTGIGHAHSNLVQGNLIGVDASGEAPLGNQLRGILVNHSQDNTIVDNVISANGEDGVLILGPEDDSDPNLVPTGNRVQRNRVGVTASGAPCGNGRHGVFVRHAQRNLVGGDGTDDANTIAANAGRGVVFSGTGARTNELGAVNEITGNVKGDFLQPAS